MDRFGAPLQWEGAALIGALLLFPLVAGWIGWTAAAVVFGVVALVLLLIILRVRRRDGDSGGEP